MMTWARPGLLAEGGTEVALLGPPECCGPQSPEASVSPYPQHTPLGTPGLYIQTLLPGSPAAADGRLSLGDQILEVNGSSLLGVSYLRYPIPLTPKHTHTSACVSQAHLQDKPHSRRSSDQALSSAHFRDEEVEAQPLSPAVCGHLHPTLPRVTSDDH